MSNRPNVVTIGSFVADRDEPGDLRHTANVEGWGTPAIRLDVMPRTGAHGGWTTGPLWAHRTIVHEGVVERGTSEDAQSVADELAALATDSWHDYTVTHETIGARFVTVRVAVGADPEWIDDRTFRYTLTLVAPDPLKKSATPTTTTLAASASDTVTVASTVDATEFEVELTSSGTLNLTVGGMTLTSGATVLPAGTVIKTKGLERGVFDASGEPVAPYPLDHASQWPAFAKGANAVANSGTASLQIVTYDTFA